MYRAYTFSEVLKYHEQFVALKIRPSVFVFLHLLDKPYSMSLTENLRVDLMSMFDTILCGK